MLDAFSLHRKYPWLLFLGFQWECACTSSSPVPIRLRQRGSFSPHKSSVYPFWAKPKIRKVQFKKIFKVHCKINLKVTNSIHEIVVAPWHWACPWKDRLVERSRKFEQVCPYQHARHLSISDRGFWVSQCCGKWDNWATSFCQLHSHLWIHLKPIYVSNLKNFK